MKRFVFIPFSLKNSKDSFSLAEKISEESKLPIRIGEENENFSNVIEIISIPEISKINFSKEVEKNYIHSIDITNEFVDMSKCSFYIKFLNEKKEIKPNIKEKHKIRIRKRYSQIGNYFFSLELENNVICSGEFKVYDT